MNKFPKQQKKFQIFTKSNPQIPKSKHIKKQKKNKNHNKKFPNQLEWKAKCLKLLILKRRRLGCCCELESGGGGSWEWEIRVNEGGSGIWAWYQTASRLVPKPLMNSDLHLWQVAHVTILSRGGPISTFFFLFLMVSEWERKRGGLRMTSCGRSFEGNDDVFLVGSNSNSSRRCISILSESKNTEERIWCLKKWECAS